MAAASSPPPAPSARLPAGVFYLVIAVGLLGGAALSAAAGWYYLNFGTQLPTGRRIWDADAASFVIPICVMIGATFGGLVGVGLAIAWDWRTRHPRHAGALHSDKGSHSVTSNRE